MNNSELPGRETESGEATDRRVPADPADPLASLVRELAALRDFGLHFVQAKADLARWRVRSLVVMTVGGAVGLVTLTAFAIYAAISILAGLAGGLAVLVGGRPWLGSLLAGLVGLGGLLLAVAVMVRASQKRWTTRKANDYEARKLHQRMHHGRSVNDAAGVDGEEYAAAGSASGP